ncbi:MAG: zinc-ribbon domain [Candidatus Parcubacteria bacterium]|jgi:DNA-directed RNA polymerase subunit RPC12/RpoP
MSLIKCNECGKDISDKAPNCPNCGNPIVNTNKNPLDEAPVVTIQKTYKRWKSVKLISWIIIIIGVMFMGGGESIQAIGVLFIISGIIGLMVARFGAWWTTG